MYRTLFSLYPPCYCVIKFVIDIHPRVVQDILEHVAHQAQQEKRYVNIRKWNNCGFENDS